VKSLHIVEEEVFGQAIAGLGHRLVLMEIDLLVFDGPPETLDKDIIKDPTATVHANWFLYGQDVKWQLNYTFREEMHGEDVDNDALITHFQVLF